jgi:homoserine acetyltransferase
MATITARRETMTELRVHYRTLGSPGRGADGKVSNAVLILHTTTGSGSTRSPGEPYVALWLVAMIEKSLKTLFPNPS